MKFESGDSAEKVFAGSRPFMICVEGPKSDLWHELVLLVEGLLLYGSQISKKGRRELPE